MIYIVCSEPDDGDWRTWRNDCGVAANAVLEEFKETGQATISDLYRDERAKRHMAARDGLFLGKCAYCESLVDVNQPGDVEHFRPKNRVTDENGTVVLLDDGEPHPGYIWLAYDFDNLLFACEDCNRPSKRKTAGQLIGKWDRFPVRDVRAVNPGDEGTEEPLLINPRVDDPSEHIQMQADGIVVVKSDRGKMCERVFGLNLRESLVKARHDAYRDATSAFKLQAIAKLINGSDSNAVEKIRAIQSGTEPFCASARAALRAAEMDALARVMEVASS